MDTARFASSLFAAQWDKHSVPELLVLVLLPAFLSFTLFKYARRRVAAGGPKWHAWLSLVPLLIGDWFGWSPLQMVLTKSYRDFNYLSDRAIGLHYAAFIAPVLCTLVLIGMLVHSGYRDRMEM